ncbi:MAG: hypothetical protein WA701_16155, partial [Solirubrobacterales bacterium]
MREDDIERVLIVQELGAPRPKRRGARRLRTVEPEMPGEVPVTRVTVTGETFAGSDDGSAWLTEILADRQRSAD